MRGTLTLHDVATVQIGQPETVKKINGGEYTVQTTTTIGSQGEQLEIKCVMVEAPATPDSVAQEPETNAVQARTLEMQEQLKHCL
jgi:hypothetical protein